MLNSVPGMEVQCRTKESCNNVPRTVHSSTYKYFFKDQAEEAKLSLSRGTHCPPI